MLSNQQLFLKNELVKIRTSTLKSKSNLDLVAWSEKYRVLPSYSAIPGKWNTENVPPLKEIMLAVTDPQNTKITIKAPTQVGKTELLLNVIGYFTHQNPSSLAVLMPNEKLSDALSVRIDSMFADSSALAELKITGGKLQRNFPGGQLSLLSARSPSDLSSRPIKVVLADEVSRYPVSSGGEGDALSLLAERQSTFFDAVNISVSSPTNDGSCRITQRFSEGDERFFHGLCPYCDNFEKLVWEQVRFDNKKAAEAYYECSHCKTAWSELDRLKAVKKGTYIATKEFEGHASFTFNQLASPWQSVAQLVEKYILAKDDPEKLKTFINTSLAETYKPKLDAPDWERLYDRREQYAISAVPNQDIVFLTAGVDVQSDFLAVQIVGWTKSKQSYTISYEEIYGATHTTEPWQILKNIILKSYPVTSLEREMPITLTCIDSGFNTSHVYNFVSQFSQNKVKAVKGHDGLNIAFKMGSDIQATLSHDKNQFAHKLWTVGSSYLKTEFYNNLKLPKYNDEGLSPNGYCHFPELQLEFFKGICSEALQLEHGKYSWVRHYRKNEPLDTYIYARAAAAMFGLDRFTEFDWAALAGLIENQNAPVVKRNPQLNKTTSNQLWRNPGLKRR